MGVVRRVQEGVGVICGEVAGQVILECQVSPYPKTRKQSPKGLGGKLLRSCDVLTETGHGGRSVACDLSIGG